MEKVPDRCGPPKRRHELRNKERRRKKSRMPAATAVQQFGHSWDTVSLRLNKDFGLVMAINVKCIYGMCILLGVQMHLMYDNF